MGAVHLTTKERIHYVQENMYRQFNFFGLCCVGWLGCLGAPALKLHYGCMPVAVPCRSLTERNVGHLTQSFRGCNQVEGSL